jgi:hypothetical protein
MAHVILKRSCVHILCQIFIHMLQTAYAVYAIINIYIYIYIYIYTHTACRNCKPAAYIHTLSHITQHTTEMRNLASHALEAITATVLRMDRQIFDAHTAVAITHAMARSDAPARPIVEHLFSNVGDSDSDSDYPLMTAEDAVLLLYSLSIDSSIPHNHKLVSWLMMTCLKGDVATLPPASVAIAVNAIGKLWLSGQLQGDQGSDASGQIERSVIRQCAEALSKVSLGALDPRTIANAVNGFSIAWQGEIHAPMAAGANTNTRRSQPLAQRPTPSSDGAVRDVGAGQKLSQERLDDARNGVSAATQNSVGAGVAAGRGQATAGKTAGGGVNRLDSSKVLGGARQAASGATLSRELSLRTIPMYEVQIDAVGELALRDEVYSVLASATMAYSPAYLARYGSSVIANLASCFSKQNWGDGKQRYGVTRSALGRHLASAYLVVKRQHFSLGDVLPVIKAVLDLVQQDNDVLTPIPFDTVTFIRQVGTKVCETLENPAEQRTPLHMYASMIHTLANAGLDTTDDVFVRIIRAMSNVANDIKSLEQACSSESLGYAVSAMGRLPADDAKGLCVRFCEALVKKGYANVDVRVAAKAMRGLADTLTLTMPDGAAGWDDVAPVPALTSDVIKGENEVRGARSEGEGSVAVHGGDNARDVRETLVAWVEGMPDRDLFSGGRNGVRLLLDIAMACRKMGVGMQLREKIVVGLVYASRCVRSECKIYVHVSCVCVLCVPDLYVCNTCKFLHADMITRLESWEMLYLPSTV